MIAALITIAADTTAATATAIVIIAPEQPMK